MASKIPGTHRPSQRHAKTSPHQKRETAFRNKVTSVTLTRKLADIVDGVDLSHAVVGDQLDLAPHDAEMLIAEGWAELTPILYQRRATDIRAQASDRLPRTRKRHPRR